MALKVHFIFRENRNGLDIVYSLLKNPLMLNEWQKLFNFLKPINN
jgi:hypothetical protein